ncbi:DciA family protein [Streptomyces sp. NPDC016626]|uniref:DciA family protein n=1 Tax=Streptomyces sp. NPDC016626 TaxID=3364968 RepID=UPI0036F6F1C1
MSVAVAMVELAETAGWPVPVDTTLLTQWPMLAGRLADHLTAVSFDPASGILRLRGESLAWTTQGRLLANQIVKDVNQALRSNTVSKVVILPFAPTASQAPVPAPTPAWAPPAFTAAAPARGDTRLINTVRLQAELAPREPSHLFPPSTDQADAPWTTDNTVNARAAARARAERQQRS